MNSKNLRKPRTISLIVEGEEYEKFVENLPKKTSASELIREYIESVNRETEKEKNACSQNYDLSAIKAINNKLSDDFKLSQKQKQPTLDLFMLSELQLEEAVLEINDGQLNSEISRKANKIRVATQINWRRYRAQGTA